MRMERKHIPKQNGPINAVEHLPNDSGGALRDNWTARRAS
jgi:hypothetical protein